MSNIKHTILENGLKVIYEKPESLIPISSVQVFCNIGNIHVPPELNGIVHFIEHMCFKGTMEHPDFNKIILKYKQFGAEWNGYTTSRSTCYVMKCQDLTLEKCVKYMSEGIMDSKFDEKKFRNEEKVVIEENVKNSDNPSYISDKISTEMLYENTAFESIADDISYHKKLFDYHVVLDFYKRTYIPSNMIVSVTSNIPFPKILAMIKKTLLNRHINKKEKQILSLHSQMLPYLLTPPAIHGVKYKIFKMNKLNTIYLNIGFQTCNQYNMKDKYILNLLSNILCNSTASRLAIILRQKYGLVYGISSNTNYTEGGGDFTITSQFNSYSLIHKGKPSVLPIIIKELNHILESGVTQSEINLSKHNIRGHLLLELENIDTQTSYNGLMYLLFDQPRKIVSYSKIYQTYYEDITKAQVNACIRKYFSLRRMCVAIVGGHIPSIQTIQRECNKLKNL
jgi:predicted Zn-dependent peptidase